MQPTKHDHPHGGVRGANLSRSSLLFEGPFGRIFRAVPPADFGPDDVTTSKNLAALAKAMVADPDVAKDGPDAEESGIPAVYTYFGQFIDHDLTFDPASSLQKQNDPDALVDFRTPRFDLDNIYGRGPDDQPYMYNADGRTFVLGKPLTGAPEVNAGAKDLQRNAQERALIGDPRNDENVIVSQWQGLWHRFHNKIALDNPTWPFPRVQQEVRFHYQWVLLHDFLPTVIAEEVLEQVLPSKKHGQLIIDEANLKYFHFRDFAFMPLEFSAAAYRFGHSMVRPGYRLNNEVKPLLIFAQNSGPDLRGFKAPRANWAIDWRRFADLAPLDYGTLIDNPDQNNPKNQNRLQLAYRIDTSLVNPLGALPASVAENPPRSLAERNLVRGWRMRLPSGQDVAKAMSITPLTDGEILIGKFTGDPKDTLTPIVKLGDGKAFIQNCPLWTYILAETLESTVKLKTLEGDKPIKTRKLGPVGGRIVAETFLGLLLGDSSSYLSLNPLWEPSLKVKGVFGLRELILHVLNS